ncbi:hypothetical protein [Streptomyces sp. NPDC059009]|uniref:hypothetical protein n=1 Tax=Streptomyces sp. NPDC059009 TaxID=3346694 RepID=UPI00369D0B9B
MGQQHGSGRGAAAAVVAAGLVGLVGVAATGCSSSGAVADDQGPGGDPAAAVRAAAGTLVRAGSSQARTSMEMDSGGTRVTVRGSGAYDYERRLGRFQVVLPKDPAGVEEHRPVTELMADGALYMKNRGAGVPDDKWVRVETATLSDGNLVSGGAMDPLAAAQLLRGARQVTYVGQERLAGTEVRHYRGTLDLTAAARSAPGANRKVFEAAAKGFSTVVVPFEAYLDEQGRLRKVRQKFSFANAGARGDKGAASGAGPRVTSTILLYGFGAPVDVRLPEGGDIYSGKIADRQGS